MFNTILSAILFRLCKVAILNIGFNAMQIIIFEQMFYCVLVGRSHVSVRIALAGDCFHRDVLEALTMVLLAHKLQESGKRKASSIVFASQWIIFVVRNHVFCEIFAWYGIKSGCLISDYQWWCLLIKLKFL